MSTLEISILIVLSLLIVNANLLASVRTIRYLGRYGLAYLAFIWLAPVVGSVFVLAKFRPARRSTFAPLAANTVGLDNNPATIHGDPWPTISQPTHSPNPFRK